MSEKRVNIENAKVIPRPDYVAVLESIKQAGFCPFCKEHFEKHHTRPILFKNEHWFATENAWPYDGARHHFVIISLAHVENAETLPAEAWAALKDAYQYLVTTRTLAGATLLMRSGDTDFTGASVSHVHAQVISGGPRSDDVEHIKALLGFKPK